MFAIGLAWLLAQLPEFAVSVAVALLKKTKLASDAQITIAETGEKILHVVGNVKTYSSPNDFPPEIKKDGV
jgi:hypothetical protein